MTRLYTDDLLDKIDPESVRSYLILVWMFDSGREIKPNGKILGYRMTNRNINSTIVVPTKAAADWRHLLVAAIESIAALEDRSSFWVIAAIFMENGKIARGAEA